MWRAIIVCVVLSTSFAQRFVIGQSCQISDVNNYNESLKYCKFAMKILTLNTTNWQSIPQNLINQTQSVQTIDISNTSLQFFNETLNLCQWSLLTYINAEYNNIGELRPNVLGDCHQLNVLNLANNQIGRIFEDAFHGLTSLKQLDLNNNKITSLSAETFKPLVQLKILRLNNNQIGAIDKDHFAHNVNLQLLDLSYNNVAVIEKGSFSKLKELHTLSIEFNPNLNAIDLKKMEKLSDLIVNNASLLQLHIPQSVVAIDANYNQIEHLSIESNSSLERLSLKNNHLRNINDLATAINLTYLDVSSNNMSQIDFTLLTKTNISDIVLLENPIHKFNVSSLMSLPKIKMLEMSFSFLDNQTLMELLIQTKGKIQLQDPNRELERKQSIMTLPPVTPVMEMTTSINRVTIKTVSPIINGSATVMPSPNSTLEPNVINQMLKRIQKLELTITDSSINKYPTRNDTTDDHNDIVQNVANLRVMIICTMVALAIFVVFHVAVFAMKHLPIPTSNIFSHAPNGRLNNRRNPFSDSMDPIIEENL